MGNEGHDWVVKPISESLERVLARGAARVNETLKGKICRSLWEAYDGTLKYVVMVDLVPDVGRPRGDGKVPPGYEVPEKDAEEEEAHKPVIRHRLNPYAMEILDRALAFGCKWAEEEMEKLTCRG